MKLLIFFFIIFSTFAPFGHAAAEDTTPRITTLPIGVVLDLNSPLHSMLQSCMEAAVSDFYSQNPNHVTRLKLHTKNAHTLLDAHLAVTELLNQEKVHVVIGHQEPLLAEVSKEHRLPAISLSVRSSSHVSSYYTGNPYLVRATPDNSLQARALASVCEGFQWHEATVFHEDTDDGNRFLSQMSKALQETEIRLGHTVSIPESASDGHISGELRKLLSKQTRVFIVHTTSPSLGSRFFRLAKGLGLLSEGYAWVITDGFSNFLSEMDPVARESMDGVLGIRPHVPPISSRDMKRFRERWSKDSIFKNSSSTMNLSSLNVYGLWAYDAVTALAIAAEKVASAQQGWSSASNLTRALLEEFYRTRFDGLTGKFQVSNGHLKLSAFEVFNVYGSGEKTVGFWTPEGGRRRELRSTMSPRDEDFRKVIWPGDSITKPESSAVLKNSVLRVGITCNGFKEFVPGTGNKNPVGFSIDIFNASLSLLPFSLKPQFHSCENDSWSYDDVLQQIPQGKVDIVVGDTTIWAPRLEFVDFAQPYLESGVVLVVKNKKPMDMWIFTRPLRWDLWLAILASFSLMGFVLLKLEHGFTRKNTNSFALRRGKRRMTYFAPVAILAFPETNMVANKWSLFVLVFWLFMAFILMQSYTANLAAILTVDQLNFAFSDDYNIGYLEGSFMEKFLTEDLHIKKTRLRNYTSFKGYHEAMSLGSKKGGIDAIFDEIPYMKILVKMYSPHYKMVGPTYRTGGFGFAFPKGSELVSPFSEAILRVVQGPNMTGFERKNFGPGYSSDDPLSAVISQQTSSLRLYDFGGLFLVVGIVTLSALFFSETPIGRRVGDETVRFVKGRLRMDVVDDGARVHTDGDAADAVAVEEDDGAGGGSNGGGGLELQPRGGDGVREGNQSGVAADAAQSSALRDAEVIINRSDSS